MNRRSFIKALGVLAATPALGKYLNVFKSAPVREGIAQGKSMGMDFFNSVIKKVMDEGSEVGQSDRIATFKHPDRADILVEVDKASGDTTVLFEADSGTKSMMQKVNTMDESTKGKNVSELFEAEEVYGPMGREEQEGITGGITNLEEFLNKKKFAMGGRVELAKGGIPRALQAALKALKSKYGKDSIKYLEDTPEYFDNYEISPYFNIDRPEKAIARDKFKNFGKPGKYNEDGTIDYDYYAQILNDVENDFVTGGESIEKLEKMLKTRLDEQAYMYDQFITGKLDPKKGESGRESFLQKKLDEVESSGDRRLITLDELDELDELKGGPGRPPGFTERKSRVPNNIPMEMMTARTIKAKYPQASDELIEMIVDLPNDKKALALADLDQVMFLEESGRSADEIITILKSEPKTKMKKGGLARILEM